MIPIEKEAPELYAYFNYYEKCCFCCKDTDTWNRKRSKPVCLECAKRFKVADIPKE